MCHSSQMAKYQPDSLLPRQKVGAAIFSSLVSAASSDNCCDTEQNAISTSFQALLLSGPSERLNFL